ncbi:SLC13 family permease [Undibacterium terreum]|uniref:Membrane protein n=1 Tax=Undibacterium terreum TaxID=1224302 RepID=A0A916XEX8_9BURK|nr:SLC13 family permease [Undibacterium terreum]GGC68322.1 membrane protein [Undibacterium terreum]
MTTESLSSTATSRFKLLLRPFQQDRLLQVLLLIAVLFTAFQPARIVAYPGWVNWPTIATLIGLIVLTKGIESSGYLFYLGRYIVNRLNNERVLAIFLVSAAALLSTVLTNDIALFIIVPLTLGLRSIAGLPIGRLVIFEALAVNAGSLLTPIGNPQNILLWQKSHLSFFAFTAQMAPLAGIVFVLLLALTALSFPSLKIHAEESEKNLQWDARLLGYSSLLYLGFLTAVEFGQPGWGLLVVIVCVFFLARGILLEVDWSLIAVFVLMFIDIRLLTEIGALKTWLDGIAAYAPHELFLAGLLGSQLISNVPATILLTKYVPASKIIAYAVNAGGFGFVLGSLANLIALRMANEKGIWLRFHFFSVPLLIAAGLVAYLLI